MSDGSLPSVSCVAHYSFVRSFVSASWYRTCTRRREVPELQRTEGPFPVHHQGIPSRQRSGAVLQGAPSGLGQRQRRPVRRASTDGRPPRALATSVAPSTVAPPASRRWADGQRVSVVGGQPTALASINPGTTTWRYTNGSFQPVALVAPTALVAYGGRSPLQYEIDMVVDGACTTIGTVPTTDLLTNLRQPMVPCNSLWGLGLLRHRLDWPSCRVQAHQARGAGAQVPPPWRDRRVQWARGRSAQGRHAHPSAA